MAALRQQVRSHRCDCPVAGKGHSERSSHSPQLRPARAWRSCVVVVVVCVVLVRAALWSRARGSVVAGRTPCQFSRYLLAHDSLCSVLSPENTGQFLLSALKLGVYWWLTKPFLSFVGASGRGRNTGSETIVSLWEVFCVFCHSKTK